MASIKFRPEVVTRSIAIGDGMVMPVQDSLVSCASVVATMADDAATETVQPPGDKAVGAGLRVLRYTIENLDAVQRQASESLAVVRKQQEQAAAAIPKFGHGGPQDYEAKTADARAQVLRQAEVAIVDSVLEARADKLSEVQAGLVDALTALSDAIDRATTEADSPEDVKIEDLAVSRDWEVRMKAATSPMRYATDKLESLIRHDLKEKLRVFLPAAQRIAVETLETLPGKLSSARAAKKRASHFAAWEVDPDDDNHDSEQLRAQQLLRAIADYQRQQLPQSILQADELLRRLKNEVFFPLIGRSPMYMTLADRSKLYFVNSSKKDATEPWPVDSAWPRRYLPPREALPGWSRVTMRTGSGVPVREPRRD